MPGPYNLAGSGIQALGTPLALHVHVNIQGSRQRFGQANPLNEFDLGLLRFGTADGFLPVIPIDAIDQVIPVPTAATQLGYALIGGTTITVTELAYSLIAALPQVVASNLGSPHIIGVTSQLSVGADIAALAPARNASFAWPLANAALFVPLRIQTGASVSQMFVPGAGGATAGNVEIGIYDDAGNRLTHSGSTAVSNSTNAQLIAVPAISLAPGNYYLALAASATTVLVTGLTIAAAFLRQLGLLQQAAAMPLPAIATFAAITSFGTIPTFGISDRAVM